MNTIILGANGMLGRYIVQHWSKNNLVHTITRKELDAETANESTIKQLLETIKYNKTTVINCIGLIKPQVDLYGVEAAIRVNSLFPHKLANVCQELKLDLVHITTDCVFSGRKGMYTEKDPHDALDVYGKTKSLGEPSNCMVIRTSIIGEEKENKRSLIEWIKSNAEKTINGYTNHLWNGVTCLQLAKSIEEITKNNHIFCGLIHLYSPVCVTKYELVDLINKEYNLNITINPTTASELCDRTLKSNCDSLVKIPELKYQIKEMREFKL